MVKRLMALAALTAAGTASAATYIVLPSPGSMTPATIIIDGNGHAGAVFVCSSASDIPAGTCRLRKKPARR